jgi:hypothetical protein
LSSGFHQGRACCEGGTSPFFTIYGHAMTNENNPDTQENFVDESEGETPDDEFETVGEYHRMAALHFSAAAKHHLAAAVADDEGNVEVTARHAFQAFRHQLNAVQYAEIAVMDNEGLDEDLESI